jgi:CheY-like chemotaxis protein
MSPGNNMASSKGTILIVEDEGITRMAARWDLEEADYSVLEAADGDEGLQVFIDHHQHIDLVLLDMQLPSQNGYELLEQMRFVRPEVRVVLFTAVVMDWEALGVCGIIQKPYNLRDLLDKVGEVMRGRE